MLTVFGRRLAARVEGEYEVLLTSRLILQPKLEADLYSATTKTTSARTLASVWRLRYEFSRRFAPCMGHAWAHRLAGPRAAMPASTPGLPVSVSGSDPATGRLRLKPLTLD